MLGSRVLRLGVSAFRGLGVWGLVFSGSAFRADGRLWLHCQVSTGSLGASNPRHSA